MNVSKLYVGNLKYSVTDTELKELFSKFGEVKSVNLIGNKGFGFVEMSSPEEAQKAKDELDGQDFLGRTLKIDAAKPVEKKEHRGGYGDRGFDRGFGRGSRDGGSGRDSFRRRRDY